MADTRGGYRAVKVVLLDGPDFQTLSERANHLFLALKLSFGPTGIEIHYPGALAAEMEAKTRIPAMDVMDTLEELREAGWLDWERNVFWIIGQLKHEPHFNAQNQRHRKAVQSHVGGLPRLAIVRRFIDRYPDYFGDAPDSLCDSLPHSPKIAPRSRDEGVGMRDEGRGITTTVDKSTEPDGSPEIDRIEDRGTRRNAYLGHFMPLLREVGLAADDTNGSIIKALADKRAPPTGMEEAIRGLVLLESVADMNGGELRLLYAKGRDDIAEPTWNRAKRAYYDSQKGKVSDIVKAS